MHKRGLSRFSVESFCLSAEKFRRGTLLYFRKILVSKNVRDKRGGGYHDFLSKIFWSHSTEKLRWGSLLCFRKVLVSKNVRDKRGGGYHDFSSKLFCLTVPKHFVRRGTLLCFRKFRVSKNFMPPGGILQFSMENLLSHSSEKIRRGTLLCFRKFRVSKNFRDKRGGGKVSRFSVKIFLSQFRKIS